MVQNIHARLSIYTFVYKNYLEFRVIKEEVIAAGAW